MSAADTIRYEIKQRTDLIAERKKSIGNLTRHVALLKDEVARLELDAVNLKADLKKLEPIKDAVL